MESYGDDGNGKVVCLKFDEFRCKTFGKCHGVKVVDDKFVFLFKHVVDIYDDNFECNESKDDEFVEVEAPVMKFCCFVEDVLGGRAILHNFITHSDVHYYELNVYIPC